MQDNITFPGFRAMPRGPPKVHSRPVARASARAPASASTPPNAHPPGELSSARPYNPIRCTATIGARTTASAPSEEPAAPIVANALIQEAGGAEFAGVAPGITLTPAGSASVTGKHGPHPRPSISSHSWSTTDNAELRAVHSSDDWAAPSPGACMEESFNGDSSPDMSGMEIRGSCMEVCDGVAAETPPHPPQPQLPPAMQPPQALGRGVSPFRRPGATSDAPPVMLDEFGNLAGASPFESAPTMLGEDNSPPAPAIPEYAFPCPRGAPPLPRALLACATHHACRTYAWHHLSSVQISSLCSSRPPRTLATASPQL